MTSNRVTITGPGTENPVYNVETSGLSNNVPFELPDDMWGIKFDFGAVIFSTYAGGRVMSNAVLVDELDNNIDFMLCRVLPGTVDITYRPVDSPGTISLQLEASDTITQEALSDAVSRELNKLNQQRRDRNID